MVQDIKILYVEDEEKIRENTKRPLGYLCSELIIAKDGEEGLEFYQKHNPDIVISDIKMPKMNGIDMVKSIKNINKDQHIIFTTAHSESGFFIEAIELQVDGYILKPIDYDLLERKIEDVTKQIMLKRKLQEQEILTQEIIMLQDNLLVILDQEQNLIFVNDNFMDFFNVTSNTEFCKKYGSLDSVFIWNQTGSIKEGNNDWLTLLENVDKTKRVISILDNNSSIPKSFFVSIKYVDKTSHIILTLTEITSIAIEKEEFEHKAFTDELTGIYNRAYFNDKLKEEMVTARRDNHSLCFILFDIDFFKKFNDNYGHQIGDEILKSLAILVKRHTRITDTFARWGGEEFIKLLPHTSMDDAKKVAETLREEIENFQFINDLKVTCSFGITQLQNNDTTESFIKRADDALYIAKNSGRNKVESITI